MSKNMNKIFEAYSVSLLTEKLKMYDISTLQTALSISKDKLVDAVAKAYNKSNGSKLHSGEFTIAKMPTKLMVHASGKLYTTAYFDVKTDSLTREFKLFFEPSGKQLIEI